MIKNAEKLPRIGDFVILKGTMRTGYVWQTYHRTGLVYIFHPWCSEIYAVNKDDVEVILPWVKTMKFHEKYIDKYLKEKGLKND